MARHHMTAEGPVPFTPDEEAARDAEEAAWIAAAADRSRERRNRLLAETDWTQTPDAPQAVKDKWAPYRQALRDVPQQPGFFENIQWPAKPE
jgi:hypothetical protein